MTLIIEDSNLVPSNDCKQVTVTRALLIQTFVLIIITMPAVVMGKLTILVSVRTAIEAQSISRSLFAVKRPFNCLLDTRSLKSSRKWHRQASNITC